MKIAQIFEEPLGHTDVWRSFQADLTVVVGRLRAHPAWSPAELLRGCHVMRGAPQIVETIRDVEAGEPSELPETHEGIAWYFSRLAHVLGWGGWSGLRAPRPLEPHRTFIFDLYLHEPSSGARPRYLIEVKPAIRYQRALEDGVGQVTEYADALDALLPEPYEYDVVLCVGVLTVDGAAKYGAARGVDVLTTRQLFDRMISNGWLDLDRVSA